MKFLRFLLVICFFMLLFTGCCGCSGIRYGIFGIIVIAILCVFLGLRFSFIVVLVYDSVIIPRFIVFSFIKLTNNNNLST